MTWLPTLLKKLRLIAHRVRVWPFLGRSAFSLALLIMILLATQGHHLDHPPEVVGYDIQSGKLVAQQGVQPAGPILKTVSLMLPYLDIWILVGGAVYLFVLLRRWGNPPKLVFPTWAAALSVAAWAISSDIAHQLGAMQMTELGEPLAMTAYWIKMVMIYLACICVPLLVHYYVRCGALERYTMRTFLAPLVFCFVAFCSLWIIMDLLDNLKEFQEANSGLGRVVKFYFSVVPFIFVSVMPASLLLAVLYTLTKMSRANEIVAMLSAGRSVIQILQPIFVVVITVAMMSLAANYHWAPRAEGNREAVMRALGAKQKDSIMASSVLYNDPITHRIWYVSTLPFSLRGERLRGVQVREMDKHGKLSHVIHADSAMWWPSGLWRFYDGKEVDYSDGKPTSVRPFSKDAEGRLSLDVQDFEETPWGMVSYALQPDYMGVPEIVSYLKAHPKDPKERLAPFYTHYYQRFALPWQSFALALVAAPLGIAYSRRGAVGGIAGSIFIFFGILFLNNLCLNLGKGGHVPPWLSPWIPHLIFGVLGVLLLHYRSQNKDLPRLSLSMFSKRKAQISRPRNAQTVS
ncbi:LPS export ABC transporter permease LptG [Prosthecobacter fusiformis]|uniref:LPS export ABC transporter permease LptG n=1 Tax=Prosthecobacter fusiformis TaxID=48464 RepID=A0A4R7S0R9_9BACT|nr:LptF/LptG family permease [Prosthecobacter fusiformis]TDU70978.1 LPS export ABC transporter permease LptG [Prosthecobacter fusiformis]